MFGRDGILNIKREKKQVISSPMKTEIWTKERMEAHLKTIGGRSMSDTLTKERYLELEAEGKSVKEIADHFGTTSQVLYNKRNYWGLTKKDKPAAPPVEKKPVPAEFDVDKVKDSLKPTVDVSQYEDEIVALKEELNKAKDEAGKYKRDYFESFEVLRATKQERDELKGELSYKNKKIEDMRQENDELNQKIADSKNEQQDNYKQLYFVTKAALKEHL